MGKGFRYFHGWAWFIIKVGQGIISLDFVPLELAGFPHFWNKVERHVFIWKLP